MISDILIDMVDEIRDTDISTNLEALFDIFVDRAKAINRYLTDEKHQLTYSKSIGFRIATLVAAMENPSKLLVLGILAEAENLSFDLDQINLNRLYIVK